MKKTLLLLIFPFFLYAQTYYFTGDIYTDKKRHKYDETANYWVKLTYPDKQIFFISRHYVFSNDTSLEKCNKKMIKEIKILEDKHNIVIKKTSPNHFSLKNNSFDIELSCDIPLYLSFVSEYRGIKNNKKKARLLLNITNKKVKNKYIEQMRKSDKKYDKRTKNKFKKLADIEINKNIEKIEEEINQITKDDLFPHKYNGLLGIKFGDDLPTSKSITANISYGSFSIKHGVEKIIIPHKKLSFFDIYTVQPKYRKNNVFRINLKKSFEDSSIVNDYISKNKIFLNKSDYVRISKYVCEFYKSKLTDFFKNKFNLNPIYYGRRTIFDTEKKRTVLMCVTSDKRFPYTRKGKYSLLLYSTDNEKFKIKKKIVKTIFNSYSWER